MFAPHLASIFATMGAAATYTAPDDAPVDCRAVRQGGGQAVNFGPVSVVLDRVRFEVLRSAIPDPQPGATLDVAGTTWTVQAAQPCERDSHGLKWSLDVAWGAPVIWRSVTGQGSTQNPPSVTGAVTVAAVASAGASAVSIKAGYVVGKLAAGDKLTIGATVHTVTGPVQGANNQFANVPIDPPLVADVAVNQPVTLTFARDVLVISAVSGYQARELQGGVQAGDVRLVLLARNAAALPETAKIGDMVAVGGQMVRAVNVNPLYQAGSVIGYEIQARK